MKTIFAILTIVGLTGTPASALEYHLTTTWGATGTQPGQFREPTGIAVDAQGFVYVADSRNKRVQKLGPDGRFVMQFGKPGDGDGEFEKPMDVAVASDGTLYVSDYALDRVQAFSPQGEFLFGWGASGNEKGRFNAPAGLAVDPQDNVYVAEFAGHRLQVFDKGGKWLRSIGGKGRGKEEFTYPTDMTITPDGRLLVADAYNHRIKVLGPEGKTQDTWGFRLKRFTGLSSAFHVPTGLATDAQGYIHIADSANRRVVLLDSTGDYLAQWKLPGDGTANVYSPTRVAAAPDGRVLAVDTDSDRILVLHLGPASGKKEASLPASADQKSVRGNILVRIEGMACPFCAYGIEKHLKEIPGVQSAQVNLGEGTAALDIAPGREVPHEAIRRAVEKAGFKASEIKAVTSTTKEKSR